MKRLRYLFAAVLLMLFMPMWRFADLLAFISPHDVFLSLALTATFALFLIAPIKLIFPKIRTLILVLIVLSFGLISFFVPGLSGMSTAESSYRHCGSLTWAGAFYSLRSLLSEAHLDDLEARNQMCWLRKMTKRVPDNISSTAELDQYMKIIRKKLLRPDIKYKVSIPLIVVLYIKILQNYEGSDESLKIKWIPFLQDISFWQNQYSHLISERQYGVTSFPHSSWIKFEYGLVERNIDKILAGLDMEN